MNVNTSTNRATNIKDSEQNQQKNFDRVKSQLRNTGFKVILGFSIIVSIIILVAAPENAIIASFFPISWSILACIALLKPQQSLICAKLWVVLSTPAAVSLVLVNGLVPAPLIPLAVIIAITLMSGAWRIVPAVIITSATFLVPFSGSEFDFAVWLRLCIANILIAVLVLTFAMRLEKSLSVSMSKSEALIASLESEKLARQSQSAFIATMSHEIRTPMNGILGLVDIVLNSELPETQKQRLMQVKYSGEVLKQILNDILDFSKLAEGKIVLHNDAMSVAQLINNVSLLFQVPAQNKQLDLRVNIDENISNNLVGDSTRITQVLSNLLSNAIKFTASGHITLSVRLQMETVSSQTLLFSVKDTGIGIQSEQIKSVFDAFMQADTSISRDYGGTGLGLQISRQLIEKMNGTISVVSNPGEGSEFYFKLCLPKTDMMPTTLQANPEPPSISTRQGRVLVVDDNTINQVVAKEMIESDTLDVVVVGSGQGAIQAVRRNHFDLILMDISMPGMSGIEATTEIRKFNADIPIISLSATSVDSEVKVALDSGMNEHLAKPIARYELLAVLAKYLPISKA